MLISALTSSTSIKVIEETIHTKPGKTVGVLKDSPGEQFVGVLKKYGGTRKSSIIICWKLCLYSSSIPPSIVHRGMLG